MAMSVNSIGTPALGTDLLSFLATQLRKEGIAPGPTDGEVTTQTAAGGSVTTIGTGKNKDIVSETSANGETLTQVGYISPVLTQNFLKSLQQALQVKGTSAANSDSVDGNTSTSPVQSLMTQLADPTSASDHQALLTSFGVLLQGSGIDPAAVASGSAGTASAVTGALDAFLRTTLPDFASKQTGQSINTTA
jgi:hypothetical protein